ncbi:hypothetical protein VF11_26770 [Nostoc linckia z14]|nr:hypothetical protein VF11_26770 [Nostoc linckia z14]
MICYGALGRQCGLGVSPSGATAVIGDGERQGRWGRGAGENNNFQSQVTSHQSPAPSPQSQIWDLGQMVNTQK